MLKNSSPGIHLKPLILKWYLTDTKMYPVQVLHMHLRATKEIRKSKTKLLISFLKPNSAVTVKTILKRIKTFLEEAGIDTNIFQGQSS